MWLLIFMLLFVVIWMLSWFGWLRKCFWCRMKGLLCVVSLYFIR